MDSILLAVFSTGAEIVRNGQQILDFLSLLGCWTLLMEPLRGGRIVRLWINLDSGTVPDHKMPTSRNIASALMRRRTTSNFCLDFGDVRNLPWIQRSVDFQFRQSHVAADTPSRNFGISTVAPAPNL